MQSPEPIGRRSHEIDWQMGLRFKIYLQERNIIIKGVFGVDGAHGLQNSFEAEVVTVAVAVFQQVKEVLQVPDGAVGLADFINAITEDIEGTLGLNLGRIAGVLGSGKHTDRETAAGFEQFGFDAKGGVGE